MRAKKQLFLLVVAHLALLAIMAQVLAVDHWQTGIEDVTGVEGSHVHASHCHGATGGCSDAGGSTAFAIGSEAVVPVPPPLLGVALRSAARRPRHFVPRRLPRPPRLA